MTLAAEPAGIRSQKASRQKAKAAEKVRGVKFCAAAFAFAYCFWLRIPRLCRSVIPPDLHPDRVKTLRRSAFFRG